MAKEIVAVDPGVVPLRTQAEFSPQPLNLTAKAELDALEKQINQGKNGTLEQATIVAQIATTAPQGVVVPEGTPVPDKFKFPDGTLADNRLKESLANLDSYLSAEKELSQIRQKKQQEQQAQIPQPQVYPQVYPQTYPNGYGYQPAPQGFQQVQAQPTFEERVNQDLQQNAGATIVNLMRAASVNAEERVISQVQDLRMKLELMEIAKDDPGIFTGDGLNKLRQTRIDNPWLDQSPTPWLNAYKLHGPINKTQPTVNQPVRNSAPILPGGQQPPTPQTAKVFTSEAELRDHLNQATSALPKDQQAKAQMEYIERVFANMVKR